MNNNLKTILMLQKKSQKDLSDLTGITEAAISHYIKGDREPKYKNMVKIAEVLDLDFEDVWGCE